MEIRLLGPLEVSRGDRAVEVTGRRLRLLLAVLALQAGQVVEAARLIDLLWDGAGLPADPANALQALVSRLRRALEAVGEGEVLVSRPPGYLLAVDAEQVDALRFERLAGAGHASLAAGGYREAVAWLRQGLALWRGPALADFAGERFAAANATRLGELRLGALEDRIEAELALGEGARLVGELEALVAEHPLRERPHALLMRALYAAGRQAEALTAYQRARQVLSERAGLDPGPELRGLEEAILAQDPSLAAPVAAAAAAVKPPGHPGPTPAPPPPPPSPPSPAPAPAGRRGRGNLRAPLTSFVGRAGEISRVLELLGRHRLVTLTGPGGVGKTRLAVEAGRRLAGGRLAADGAWMVEVAGLRDGRLLPLVVLDALGLGEERPRLDAPAADADAEERLLAALERRRALLLLDNCEHLADAAADLVERLLAACPELRVLATSREPLRVPGEVRWPVPALPVPPPGPVGPEQLTAFAGTRLFLERAAAAAPGLAVAGDAAPVAEICRRLDGLPLAIELAAARVGALPPAQLAARLDDRFRLLTAGARTALPRQQTLRAVVDWSWDLLDRPERAVLRRLAVFAGGCTLAAAEAVCAGPELAAGEVAAVVSRLVDKSLVTVGPASAPPAPWWPGIEALELPPPPEPAVAEPRYGLLETVRAYAAERLGEAGESERVARAHAQWCVELAEAAEEGLHRADQLVWFWRLSADLDNLRAALQWLLDRGEAALAVRLAAALSGFLHMAGHREEAARSLAAALALPGEVPPRARGLALFGLAWADPESNYDARGPTARAEEARVTLERAAGNRTELLYARVLAAIVGRFSGAGQQAERVLDESMEEVEAAGDWPAAIIRLMRGFIRTRQGAGSLAARREDGEVALARFRQLGDRWGMVQALELLSFVDLLEARDRRAGERLREALRCAWELRMASELGIQLCRLAHLAMLQDDLEAAGWWLRQALAASRELGQATETAFARAGLGLLAQRRGEPETARRELEQALALLQPRSRLHPLGFALLSWLGSLAEQQGDLEGAVAMYRQVLELARWHDNRALSGPALEGLAGVARARGDDELAAVLLGAGAAARRTGGAPPAPGERVEIERIAAGARRALGSEPFAAARARGEAMPPEEAAALALSSAGGTAARSG